MPVFNGIRELFLDCYHDWNSNSLDRSLSFVPLNLKKPAMFENEIAINELQLRQFAMTAPDIPEEDLYHPSIGHGHPPIWIMGHLAITAEMGQRMLGGTVRHPQWVRLFGRGSSDIVSPQDGLTKK